MDAESKNILQIKFRCHQCGQKYRFNSTKFGRVIKCRKCQTNIQVPQAILDDGTTVGREASLAGLRHLGLGEGREQAKALAEDSISFIEEDTDAELSEIPGWAE